jgi:hypothetical protein
MADEAKPAMNGGRRRAQFSLRALLLGVTVAAVLCGLVVSVSPLWTLVIGWFFVLVVGHVLGNWLGTRLRQRRQVRDAALDGTDEQPDCGPIHYAPTSRLRHHVALGRSMFISTAISTVAGCALGVVYLVRYSEHVTISGLAVGAISAAVIGGVFGFLTSAFVTVTMCAIHEASGGRRAK